MEQMKRADSMVSKGPSLQLKICNNITALFFRKGEATSISWVLTMCQVLYTFCLLCPRTSCGVALPIPVLCARPETLREAMLPNEARTTVREQQGWQWGGPGSPHFNTHCFFMTAHAAKASTSLKYFPFIHTHDEKNKKLSKVETGENYLKSHHLRNFWASLISDKITSFCFIYWVSGHI